MLERLVGLNLDLDLVVKELRVDVKKVLEKLVGLNLENVLVVKELRVIERNEKYL